MPDSPAARMLQTLQSSAQPANQQWLQPSDAGAQPTTSTSQTISQPPADTVPPVTPSPLSNQQKLATFEALLSEMDAEKQAANDPQAQTSQPAPDQPPQDTVPPQDQQPTSYSTTGVRKEQAPGTVTPELPGGMQYVESEPNPEIPAEVENFLQKVEEDHTQLPQEIVIAAEQHAAATAQRALPQDVKVLPITATQAEEAKKKNTSFSIKWLLTFSEKLVQMFKGQTIYRTE